MNNLHKELAPISDAAWKEIEQEACRTFTRRIAGRRVVDMPEPKGLKYSALGTGHVQLQESPEPGVQVRRREVQPVIELRVPFTVARQDVDDVDRGAIDANWDAVKAAAEKIALIEDRVVFNGIDSANIEGIIPASSNEHVTLPEDIRQVPDAVARAMNILRLVGVEGPYTLLLSAELFTAVAETTDHGYPVRDHISRMLGEDGHIVWAPALEGALLVSERGGDFELHLGEDLSIGYLTHDLDSVQLYLEETLTFRVATSEASVVLSH